MSEGNYEAMATNTSPVFNRQQDTSYASSMLATAASYPTVKTTSIQMIRVISIFNNINQILFLTTFKIVTTVTALYK